MRTRARQWIRPAWLPRNFSVPRHDVAVAAVASASTAFHYCTSSRGSGRGSRGALGARGSGESSSASSPGSGLLWVSSASRAFVDYNCHSTISRPSQTARSSKSRKPIASRSRAGQAAHSGYLLVLDASRHEGHGRSYRRFGCRRLQRVPPLRHASSDCTASPREFVPARHRDCRQIAPTGRIATSRSTWTAVARRRHYVVASSLGGLTSIPAGCCWYMLEKCADEKKWE